MIQPKQHLTRLACAILCGSALVSSRADYPAQVLANGPVGYWRLNENVVVPPPDLATNLGSLGAPQNGFYRGAAAHPVDGALAGSTDTAANFTAAAPTSVIVPYGGAALNPNTFTVEAWLNPGVQNAAGTLTAPLSSGVFSDPRAGWLIYQTDTGWNLRLYNRNALNTSLNITGGTAPEPGTWYHVVATFDGTTGKIFVNGVEVATGAATGYVAGIAGPMLIGARADNAFWWNGSADEVAVYNGALTASVIQSHYQNGTNATRATPYEQLIQASNPLAYLRLNEPAYTAPDPLPIAANSATTGSLYEGTYQPGVDAQVAGPRPTTFSGFTANNTAAGLNGNAGHVSTFLSLNDYTAFTVMGWLKRGALRTIRGGYFGQNDLLEIGDADNGTNIEVWINAFNTNVKIPYAFADDQWGHFAVVGEPTKVFVYTNGVLAGSTTRATPVVSFGSSAFLFNIGGGGIFNATGDNFRGSIDEVSVFDKALSATEVQQIYFGANIAPVIIGQPTGPTRPIVTGNTVTMSVSALGTAPLTYQWRKGGQNLPTQTSAQLLLTGVTQADAGTYDVVVSNGYGSATSNPVTITVGPTENVPPTVQYADSGLTFNTIQLIFSEPLDATTAQNSANYTITDGTSNLAVTGASLARPAGTPGDNTVILTTATQTAGKTYTVTINNVKDQTAPGNTIAANSTIQVKSWVLASGYLRFEHFDNLQGPGDADITASLQDPRVIADTPTTEGFLSGRFDTRTIFGDDTHEFFLAKITGWIVPTETADYYFFLRSDDAGRLYLSTTEALPNPSVDTPIAIETGCCGAFTEPGGDVPDPATTQTPIHLVAGQRYGVLALEKEHGGGDYLQVAWRKSTDTTPAATLLPIPGQYLQTYVDPNVNLAFTTQPTDMPGVLPSTVVEFVNKNFATDDGGFTVENTDPAPLGPFGYDTTAGAWVAAGASQDCVTPSNSKLTSPAFTVPVADQVKLTFEHRYSFEADRWDGGQIWISKNGGAFTPVNPDNFTQNGYPPGVIQGTGVILNQRAFHDESPGYATNGYVVSSVLLGSFAANDTIVVQFVGAWDECTSGPVPSWAIKNVKLEYGTAPQSTTFTAAATASKQGVAVPFTYQWQRNDGSGWVDILNENTNTFRIFPVAADFSAQFRLVARVPGAELISNAVKLTGGPATPTIAIAKTGPNVTITYTGTLQSSTTVNGTYNNVPGATNPYNAPNSTTGMMFFRSVR